MGGLEGPRRLVQGVLVLESTQTILMTSLLENPCKNAPTQITLQEGSPDSTHLNVQIHQETMETYSTQSTSSHLYNIFKTAKLHIYSRRSPGVEMGTHSTLLAWKIPLTEGPGRLQIMG